MNNFSEVWMGNYGEITKISGCALPPKVINNQQSVLLNAGMNIYANTSKYVAGHWRWGTGMVC